MPSSPRRVLVLALCLCVVPSLAFATEASEPIDAAVERLQDDAVRHLQEYLRIDTVNPPGNETRAVELFARILDAEGVPYESVESAPGRGNLWARLDGGDEPALVLLHHSDVVTADPAYWDEPPLSGAIRDGYLYGRGALDTKGLGILHLETFLELHRRGEPLRRDVIFMATADEEAGGFFGAGWLVENRPELFADVGLLLNEGGGGSITEDGQTVFGVEVTQKVPLWLRLTTRGTPGHGSRPLAETAVTRLVQALARLDEHRFEARAVPAVARYLEGLATVHPSLASDLADLEASLRDPDFLEYLRHDFPRYNALLHNTCSLTVLEGSTKINVIPPEAHAEIDCRLLPDQDPDVFLQQLREVLDEPELEIERIMGFTPAVSSTETDLYRAIEDVLHERHPEALILPSVSTGFTDSHFFRDLGIDSYGFSPVVIPVADEGSVHGNNERIPIEELRRGVLDLLEIVERVVY
jgi:acetylornithine deacetylase/succinyl-diaminopimelate desuccinylase-like protein